MSQVPSPETLIRLLREAKVIAVVGYSENPERPSHYVSAYLAEAGYRIIPVNPGLAGKTALGETIRASLSEIPKDIPVEIVDIFRRSEQVGPVVSEALAELPQLRAIWMQAGITNPEAAAAAEAMGKLAIQDRCLMVEHRRLIG